MIISTRGHVTTDHKVILDRLNFLNSSWIIYGVNVEIINCNTASLVLELQYLKHAIIQNCTFGHWLFQNVNNAFIKNCTNTFNEGVPTSLTFNNSSASLINITIEHEHYIGDFIGIVIYNHGSLHVQQSKFVNNTVEHGIIKTLWSSSLSNCTVMGNHGTGYPGAVYANASFVHLEDTYFNSNTAFDGGGAIMIENMSFLQIKNCTFKNNSVDREIGDGGAIVSTYNSVIDISYSIFEYNKAHQGGAIHHQNRSKTKLNQCSFVGNSESAITSLISSEMSIMNSIFQNNLAKHQGGAVAMREKSVLNVSNTTFINNAQTISSTLNMPPHPIAMVMNIAEGGGAIYLSKSVGNISKSTFENNFAVKYGGAIKSIHSSMNLEYSTFQNNSVLDEADGMGGGLFIYGNSTIKISNVLFYKCHASKGGAIGRSTNFTTIIMSSSCVISNTGSAIYLILGDSFEINNSTFSNNSTPESGGAIFCRNYCVVKMVDTKFSQNRVVQGGGAFVISDASVVSKYNVMSNLTAHRCLFTDNSAYAGGAMFAFYSFFNIVDSNFSNNFATEGGAAEVINGYLVMTNCRLSNNTAQEQGGVVDTTNGTLDISNCLVFNNAANVFGGVVISLDSEIVVTTSIFKMNSVHAYGGVFRVNGGNMIWRNSQFTKNIAGISGGVFVALGQAVIKINESVCFENKARYSGGVCFMSGVNAVISDTIIRRNSQNSHGVLEIDNTILEIYRSQIEGNSGRTVTGALHILNSLFVAINASFKGNTAYEDSTISIENSTVYLEKCTFLENRLTRGGTISFDPFPLMTTLKISNTIFTQNEGCDIVNIAENDHFINKFETHRCSFVHGNISLKSNMTNFKEVAVKEKVIGQYSGLNQSFFKPGETLYASSKMFHILIIQIYTYYISTKDSLNQEKRCMPQVRCLIYL